jgi:ParB family chromosome partitioning protein
MFKLALDRVLDNPYQTRISYDTGYIRDLAKDIASRARTRPGTRGLLQVPLARVVDSTGQPVESDVFKDFLGGDVTDAFQDQDLYAQLAFGHNRLRAFRLLAGETDTTPIELGLSINDSRTWRRFPVQYAHLSDEEMATAAWTENSQRKDLSPLEEARALQRALDQFGWTQTRLSDEWGLAASTISNKRRLLRLPDMILDPLGRGEISERAAAALIPLYDLPGPILDKIRDHDWYSPAGLLEYAQDSKSSDWIRQKANYVITAVTEGLSHDCQMNMMMHTFDGDDLRTPQCTECDLLIDHNDEIRCGDRDCYQRKMARWKRHRLELASDATGLPILPEDDKLGCVEKFLGNVGTRLGQEIYAEGSCDCLHLRWAGWDWEMDRGVHLESYPDVAIACYHPDKRRCECLAARKAANTKEKQANDPDFQEKKALERETAKIVDLANQALATALLEFEPAAWLMVLWNINSMTNGKGHDWDIQKLASKIAKHALRHTANLRWVKDDPDKSRRRIEEAFEDVGLPIPTLDAVGGNGRAYTAEEVLNNRELLSKVRTGEIEVDGLEEALNVSDRN